MSLVANAEELKGYIGLSKSASEKAFSYQPQAERELKKLITAETYESLEDDLPDGVDAKIAARAESLLALHHSLPVMNMRAADNGGLLRLVGHGDYQEELMSPNQMEQVRKQLYAMVKDLVQDYMPDLTDEDAEDYQYQGNGWGFTAV